VTKLFDRQRRKCVKSGISLISTMVSATKKKDAAMKLEDALTISKTNGSIANGGEGNEIVQPMNNNKMNPFSPTVWAAIMWEVISCKVSKDRLPPPQSTLDIPNYNREIARTEEHFRWAAYFTLFMYGVMLFCAYSAGADSEEELSSRERSASFLGMVCLGVTVTLQLIPVMLRISSGGGVSGIIFATIVVQSIALTTSALITYGIKPPILIDEVTGARVHLLRWAEWIPVGFLMTFLVEAADAPDVQ
jgi:hypothetical protein